MITLELSNQLLIEVYDHNQPRILHIPERQVLDNIPVIWAMLEQVIQDWTTAASAYPSFAEVKKKDKQAGLALELEAFDLFKPRIFQCLFSYIIFFFMLENGYYFVYYELNRLNRELGLQIRHKKPPKRTDYINDLWKLRTFTIGHWAGTEKKNMLDSIVGRPWGYFFGNMKGNENNPLDEELFGDMEHIIPGVSGAAIASIPETHNRCSIYLSEYDQVCAAYLRAIIAQMPKTLNGVEYHSLKWTDSG